MTASLKLQMSDNLYLRDPQETTLGKNIIRYSIKMIDELGLEDFTFKKLSIEITSTEASIYRYFENKHKLLVYLISWYWNWLEYSIEFETRNIHNPKDRLLKVLCLITEVKGRDAFFPDVDETALQRIVISESDKTYLTKQVDSDNNDGLFRGYKSLCAKIASIILEINPNYLYAKSLVVTALQAAHQQVFFAKHLPALTDYNKEGESIYNYNYHFIKQMILKAIQ